MGLLDNLFGATSGRGPHTSKSAYEMASSTIRDLVDDLTDAIKTNAPDFKFACFMCGNVLSWGRSKTANCSIYKDSVVIVSGQGANLRYRFLDHGFSVESDDTKKVLAEILQERFNGELVTESSDHSRDERPLWRDDCYCVLAHDGLKEYQKKEEQRKAIRSC